ncbi:hypothetical protein [uncultured Bacteroides sp.]|uniref:hypothetical protein n=1 Tax=uncultured Bacteroides sp. TaxID=162156 RepID=UPI002AAB7B9F|nr:hypothetical protein [uncultured Bacteroides sp.]
MAQEKDAIPGTAKHTATLEQLKRVNDQLAISQQRVRGETEKQTTSFLSMSKMKASIVGFFAGIGASVSGLAYNFINNTSEFINKSISMSSAADGIKHAFERLNRPDLLSNLRKETKGTVNDVNLMKAAVKADFFKVPLDNLGIYLKFAQQRAQDTGQSVDELVEKLISGLGRKSTKVLAQLGLSTTEVNAKTKETGDFMTAVSQIIENELAKSTDDYTAASTRAAQRTAALENKMLLLGDALRPIKGQYNALKQTVQIFFADTAIWIAEHKEMLITATSAIVAYYSAVKIAAIWQAKYKEETLLSIAVEKYNIACKTIGKSVTLLYAAATALLEGNITKAKEAMILFNATTKISPIGVLTALVAAGAAAFLLFKNNVSVTKTAISDLNTKLDIEKTSLNNIFEEMKRTNPGTSQRIALVKQLNEKYPGLISNYNLESASLKQITAAQNEANEAIINRVSTSMKAQMMTDVITNNITKQHQHINNILDIMKQNMGDDVFKRIEPNLRIFLSDQSKTVDDLNKKYGKLFSNRFGSSDWSTWETELSFLRNTQKGLKGEMDSVTSAYKPYIDSLKSAKKVTHELTDEEKKQLMEKSSIITKLNAQKQHVQDTWKEDTKDNISLKNKELERIDKEISKYQELGKSKRNSNNGTYTSEVDKALSPIENTHQKELLSLSATKEKEFKTEAEYNKKVLLEDKRYYAERLATLVNLENTVSKTKTKTRDEINKKETEARSKLIETQRKYDENEITLLQEQRDKKLSAQNETYNNLKTKTDLDFAKGEISEQEHGTIMLTIEATNSEERLKILKEYQDQLKKIELKTGSVKVEAIKKAENETLKAELDSANARKNLYLSTEKEIDSFKKDYTKSNEVEQTKLELANLEKRYKDQRAIFKDNKDKLLEIEEIYNKAKDNIIKTGFKSESDKLEKQIDAYKQYGTTIGEALGNVLSGQEDMLSAFGGAMIDTLFDVLTQIVNQKLIEVAAVAVAEQAKATLVATALPDSVATFGLASVPRIAIMAGLITAALTTAKFALKGLISKGKNSSSTDTSTTTTTPTSTTRIINPGYSEGGYTGDGGRYEIAGAVHRGEYVVPAPEMNNPRVIDSIKVIESVRRQRTGTNPLPGYAEGGYVSGNSGNNQNYESTDVAKLLKEIKDAITDPNNPRKSYVLLSDINKQQDLKIKAEKPFTRGDKK